MTPRPSCGRGECLERLFCAIVLEDQDVTIQLFQDIRKAKGQFGADEFTTSKTRAHKRRKRFLHKAAKLGGGKVLSRRSSSSDLLHSGDKLNTRYGCVRSRESISLAPGAPRHVVNGSALSPPVCGLQDEKIEFHWLPRLGSENVLQLVAKCGHDACKHQHARAEGGLDECGWAFCPTLLVVACTA